MAFTRTGTLGGWPESRDSREGRPIDDAPRLLSNCAERVMRMVMVGREM